MRSQLTLRDKPEELLSSIYLLGALSSLSHGTRLKQFKAYGLLVIRNHISIGVELVTYDNHMKKCVIILCLSRTLTLLLTPLP